MSIRGGVDRSRAVWWAFGVSLAAVLGFVIYTFVGTFVFGVFIYYATRPVYKRLKRRVRPRSLAAALSLFALALPVILLLAYAIAIGIQEFDRFSRRYEVGPLESYIQPYLDVSRVPLRPEEFLAGDGISALGSVIASASEYVGFIGNGLLHLFVMIGIAFYLLRDDYKLSRWVRRRFSDEDGVFEAYLAAVDHNFHQIFFGNILNAALTGVIGVLSYNLLNVFAPAGTGLPYPSLLGLLTGVASLVPIVGMKLVYFPATAYLLALALVSGEPGLLWFPAVFAAVSFVVVDLIPDLVIRPYVSGGGGLHLGAWGDRLHLDVLGRRLHVLGTPAGTGGRGLHLGMVMFAYVLGPLLFGWYGIFLGPMLLVLVVQFTRLVLPELVMGRPIEPVAVDPANLTDPAERAEPVDRVPDGPDANPGDHSAE